MIEPIRHVNVPRNHGRGAIIKGKTVVRKSARGDASRGLEGLTEVLAARNAPNLPGNARKF
jgi:hypothetical protein